jgi:hypothetical protein
MPGGGGVLALDISLSTGWCWGDERHLVTGPVWGVWLLPPNAALGRRLVAFENELADAISLHQPAVIAIEAPMPAGVKGSAETARLLLCLAGTAEATAYRWERKFIALAVQTVRADVCGRCWLTELESRAGLNVKDQIVAPWVAKMGWHITDNNARDAAVVWAHEMGIRADKGRATKRRAA